MVTAKEATRFFQIHEVKCDEELVNEWMDKNQVGYDLKSERDAISEWDMYNFSAWHKVRGTAYEEGIDDKTRIERLLEEIADLKSENTKLQQEKYDLLAKLTPLPF